MVNLRAGCFRALLFLYALLLGAGFAAGLCVTTEEGTRLARLDLAAEPAWCLLWNHSVAGFLVRDCFRYEEGSLLLVSHHTPDFAAGLGPTPGRGTLGSDARGGYLIDDIDEALPNNRLVLRVGSLAVDHRLEHAGRLLSLSARAAGSRVTLQLTDAKGRCSR